MKCITIKGLGEKSNQKKKRYSISFVVFLLVVSAMPFKGIYLDIGFRQFSVSALLGALLVVVWGASKISGQTRGYVYIGTAHERVYLFSILAYFVLALTGSFYAELFDESRFYNLLFTIGTQFAIVLITFDLLRSKKQIEISFQILLIGSFLASLVLIWYAGNGDLNRAAGLLSGGNPNYAGHRLLPLVLIPFGVLALGRKHSVGKWNLVLLVLGSLVGFIALLLTRSGGVFVSLASCLVVVFALLIRRRSRSSIRAVAIAGIGIGGVITLLSKEITPVVNRISRGLLALDGESVDGPHSSIETRIDRDLAGIEVALDHVFGGVGLGQHQYYLHEGLSHNQYIFIWMELGSVGLFLTLLLVALPILRKNALSISPGLWLCAVGMAIHYVALGGIITTLYFLVGSMLLRAVTLHRKGREWSGGYAVSKFQDP